jgi:uncharacterized protein YjbI with pentapeptide repeats
VLFNKPPDQIFAGRINQDKLDEMIMLHERFVLGIRGGKRLVLQFMNLSGLSFRERNLTDGIFAGSAFIQADLTDAVFDRANLFGCDLRHAILDGASLKKADLRGVCARGARLNGADMLQADLREGQILISELSRELQALYVEIDAPNVHHAMDYGSAKLSRAKLSDVTTTAADFREAEMNSVRMRHTMARGANFEGANMENIDLSGADMTGVNLHDANMLGAVIEQTKLDGANMNGTITDKNLKQINNLEQSLDILIQLHQRWVSTAGQDGEPLDLSGYDMRSSTYFTKARLTAIKAKQAVFFGMNLTGMELQYCELPDSDFRNCTLNQADLRASDLAGCKFNKAKIQKADFGPLMIQGEQKPVNLRGAHFRYCDMRGTNFQYADLTGADLSFALMDGVDLRHAVLDGVHLEGANIKDALLSGQFDKPLVAETNPTD